jgi:hypothetical protein
MFDVLMFDVPPQISRTPPFQRRPTIRAVTSSHSMF